MTPDHIKRNIANILVFSPHVSSAMFALSDHLLHLEGEALPREMDAQAVRCLLAGGLACRAPVTGAVYGTLLNDRASLDALGEAMHAPPYGAPPKAPILYVKPRNTLAGHRAQIDVPADAPGIEVGVSLGIVLGHTATRVQEQHALDYVAGYTTVADLSIPHASVYRPAVRFRARDRFCVIGPALVAKRHVATPDRLALTARVTGQRDFTANTASFVRGVARLIADVTDFMTLSPGDILTLGAPHGAPIAHAGEQAVVAAGGFAPLQLSFVDTAQSSGARS